MQYRRKSIDSTVEKQIITGMITNDKFLREFISILNDNLTLIRLSYARTIAQWCIDYYNKYEKAPSSTIEDIYNSSIRKGIEQSEATCIATFLKELSNSYQGVINVPYELDKAERYIRLRIVEQHKEDIDLAILEGDVERAELACKEFKRLNIKREGAINVLTDKASIKEAYESLQEDVVLRLPGALGGMVGPLLVDDFVALLGPKSRGKSYMLFEFAFLAALSGQPTLIVSLEMTKKQCQRRLSNMIMAGKSIADTYTIPVVTCMDYDSCRKPEKQAKICSVCRNLEIFTPTVGYRQISKNAYDIRDRVKKGEALQRLMRGGILKLIAFPSRSISIGDLEVVLDNMEQYDNFVPRVICTDYTDIFKRESHYEYRHSLNDVWELQRGLGQKKHVLMLTVSHTNKTTFKKNIGEGDVSEDSRKENHATHLITLNQTDDEKENGIIRMGMTKRREEYYNVKDEVIVLQALSIGKPILDSF